MIDMSQAPSSISVDGTAISNYCQPLIEAANLNIYRENPFRITGLPTDAGSKDMARHAGKLKMLEELGHSNDANAFAFALNPPPSLEQIRAAFQRLKDPEKRIIDEFFWFWPENFGENTNTSDLAIEALRNGDAFGAHDIWAERENQTESGY